MIDAKYMDSKEGVPKDDIVNQMIIAMDYGNKKERVDLGFVLFADKEDQKKDIIVEKSNGIPTKRIYFLNMHPENRLPTGEYAALKKVKSKIVHLK